MSNIRHNTIVSNALYVIRVAALLLALGSVAQLLSKI